ncbi:MAG: LytR C-terminal domain-containing protein [Coriobacteriia bacterium]|jgi:hypothetical protein|nr:LytR C-terminal domain-containing protein [Coriobacteriia bacterium]
MTPRPEHDREAVAEGAQMEEAAARPRRSSRHGPRHRREPVRARHAKRAREQAAGLFGALRWPSRGALASLGFALGALGLVVVLLWGVASTINGVARWNAKRLARAQSSPEAQAELSRDNLLVIGVSEGRATGFLAMRVMAEQQQVFGIAIPDGAFIEVPGQGFERMGDSYLTGGETSLAAVTNFFSVPFTEYVVVDSEVYQEALAGQSVSMLLAEVHDTNLDEPGLARWETAFNEIPTDDVALVPLPVKPVNVGSQTYFEPQRQEIADLVASWWGVTLESEDPAIRVIVYNGSGEPGIAGQAAQLLIRGGFRVVDTKNADTFDYHETQIVIQRGDASRGDSVREVLGVGTVIVRPANQEVADVVVIIGSDFKPPANAP